MPIEYEILLGAQIQPYIDALAELRIKIFREYPYLYDGSMTYERQYLSRYGVHPSNLCVIAKHGSRIVGATTAMWLNHADKLFQTCFVQQQWPMEKIFYFGESVLLEEFRGKGLGHEFFNLREQHAKKLDAEFAAFCAVERADTHPLKPEHYRGHNAFWAKRGYRKYPNLNVDYMWQDLDHNEESPHKMVFWVKPLVD